MQPRESLCCILALTRLPSVNLTHLKEKKTACTRRFFRENTSWVDCRANVKKARIRSLLIEILLNRDLAVYSISSYLDHEDIARRKLATTSVERETCIVGICAVECVSPIFHVHNKQMREQQRKVTIRVTKEAGSSRCV